MKTMKIKGGKFLITGGASMIGAQITEQLLEAGAREIVLFDNYSLASPDGVADLLEHPQVKLVRGDILRANELYDNLEGTDGVFAVAGFLTLPMSQNPHLGVAVNVQGMLNTFDACRYRNVGKVVFSSSIAVYGEPTADLIDETTSWTWSKLQPGAALYASSKIMGENFGKLYHDRYGVKSISLRYSSVYGERQHLRAVNSVYIMETYERLKRGERPIIPDDGREVHDYIHVADVARANLAAMESEVSRESFNVATGTATSLNGLVEIVQKITGTRLEPEYKTPAGKVRAAVSTKLDFSVEKIERMLGWKAQVSFEEGIRRLIAWRERELRKVA
jgi:UDP-glucose 4-epimerase